MRLSIICRFRYNAALKILFFEILKDLGLISEVPPWYSKTQPNRRMRMGVRKHYEMYRFTADSIEVRTNRIDARIVEKEQKRV